MSPWSDSAAIVAKLVRQLNRFDWGSVHQTCDALIKQLGQDSQPFPLDPAKQVLSQLRRKRQFDTMERVADARDSGRSEPCPDPTPARPGDD